MTDPRQGDHALGIELQLEELVEQRTRAQVQNRPLDAAKLDDQIAALQMELGDAANMEPKDRANNPPAITEKN
ncbi:MAG: hypothetical protein ACRD0I_09165 [Acidimicrobiales bacterium]